MSQARYEISKSELGDIKSICVFAWGLLGDVFIRLPVMEKLKQVYPQASLTVVVDPVGALAIKDHPDIDNVFIMPRKKKPLWQYLNNTLRSIWYLRKQKFDLSVNLYSGGSSPTTVKLINARVRLGFDHTDSLRKSNNLLVKHPHWCQQWIKAFATVLTPLGIDPGSVRIGSSFYFPQVAEQFARQITQSFSAPHFTINLGAGDPGKCWSVANYVRLAERIHDKYGLIPVVISNPGQEYLAEEFASTYTGEMLRLPVTSIENVGAVMAAGKFVVTGDTSLMHIAFGLHKPTLVVFAYTRPEWHIVEDCPLVYCFKENPAVIHEQCQLPVGDKDISVDEVFAKFERLCQMTSD